MKAKVRNEMGTHGFNLVDEKWIPCIMLDGSAKGFGLLEALTRAYEIREIFDSSPLVTASLHRLLLAILHRSFGPPSLAEWMNLWNQRRWDRRKLSRYFSDWHHRFDLFDVERPFYQTCEIGNAEKHPAVLLAMEASSGNNATLFEHSSDSNPMPLSPAEAARYLVTRQAYSIGFGKSSPFYFSDSPLIRGMMVMVEGDTLFETTALNLLVYDRDHPFPSTTDIPVWERDKPATPDQNGSPILGYLDYLTWQSRRIHLVPEGDPTVVRFCQLQQNLKLRQEDQNLDPFKCFRRDEKRGYVPLNISKGKALWRDSHVLLQTADLSYKRPGICDWLTILNDLRRYGRIQAKEACRLSIIGLATDTGKAASVAMWRHERMPLPLKYLADEALVEDLKSALKRSEEASEALAKALRQLAIVLLPSAGGRVDWNSVSNVTQHLAVDRLFWSRLEIPFHHLVIALPGDRDKALETWITTLRRGAWDAFEDATRDLDQSARTLKALVEARDNLNYGLQRALDDFKL